MSEIISRRLKFNLALSSFKVLRLVVVAHVIPVRRIVKIYWEFFVFKIRWERDWKFFRFIVSHRLLVEPVFKFIVLMHSYSLTQRYRLTGRIRAEKSMEKPKLYLITLAIFPFINL